MKKGIRVLLLVGLTISSCGHLKDRPDVIAYAENPEHGLRKVVQEGDIIYTFLYKPVAYILKTEHLDSAMQVTRKKALSGTVWFNISISVKDWEQSPLRYKVSGVDEYAARQDYYLNQAPKDIYMLYGKDTLHLSSYWFENNQNLASHETIIAGFILPDHAIVPEKDLQLYFYDRVFKNGIIKTIFKAEDIAHLPNF